MITIYEFSKQITKLKIEKDYKELLAYFKINKINFNKQEIAQNQYIISDMITAMRHTDQHDAAFRFLEIYGIYIDEKSTERMLSAYGWLLWDAYKHENIGEDDNDDIEFDIEEEDQNNESEEYNESKILKEISRLTDILLKLDSDYTSVLISNLFSTVIKYEKKKRSPNWKFINEYCDKFNIEEFSKECKEVIVCRKGINKKTELASDLENWYAVKTQCLLKLGKWKECFELSKQGLEKIEKFHYSNDIWLSRRIALSMQNLGNISGTIKELEKILKKKGEWFIQKELSELYFENKEFDKSLKSGLEAINSNGPLDFKIDLLVLLGDLFNHKNEKLIAAKHYSLSRMIRLNNQWRVPAKLNLKIAELENENYKIVADFAGLKRDLNGYWKNTFKISNNKSQNKAESETKLSGVIKKIFHDNERGKDGIIECENRSYYFSVPTSFYLTSLIKYDSKVVFKISGDDVNEKKPRIWIERVES